MPKRRRSAIAYLRVSSRSQADGDGFDRQEAAIRTYAKRAGFELVEWYRDEGVSGTLEDRPGLMLALDRVTNRNAISALLVESADRWTRDLVIGELLLTKFRDAGVRVITSSGVDLTDGDRTNPTAKLIRQVLAAVAEFDRDMIAAKLRAARDRVRARDGRCEGRKPFGHREGEAGVLERISTMRRRRKRGSRLKPSHSYQEIADVLNGEGLTTRTGKRWTSANVQRLYARSRSR